MGCETWVASGEVAAVVVDVTWSEWREEGISGHWLVVGVTIIEAGKIGKT